MKLGVIGFGNMGRAIIEGNIKKGTLEESNIYLANRSQEKLKKFKAMYDVNICKKNIDVVKNSDVIILAVKPNIIKSVLEEIKGSVENKIIISVSVATTMEDIEKIIGDKKIVRAMPNTPLIVASGVVALALNKNIKDADKEKIEKIFASCGVVEYVLEKDMDAVSAISGSLPAYVYMFIEAVADGGVLNGLSREVAYKLASQTVLGSAKMVLETKEHPAKLKDNVTSPAGTTIEGLKILEKNNFRYALIESQKACVKKAKQMREK